MRIDLNPTNYTGKWNISIGYYIIIQIMPDSVVVQGPGGALNRGLKAEVILGV